MTFLHESTRILFHQLPTKQQVALAETEALLAAAQLQICVEGVTLDEGFCEVTIRVSNRYSGALPRSE